jgi:hypothetical protein
MNNNNAIAESSFCGIKVIEVTGQDFLLNWLERVKRKDDYLQAVNMIDAISSVDCVLVGGYTEDVITVSYMFRLTIYSTNTIEGFAFLMFPFGDEQKHIASRFVKLLAFKLVDLEGLIKL